MRDYYRGKKKDEIERRGGRCENCGVGRIEVLRIVGRKKKKILCENCIRIKKVEPIKTN